MNTFGIEIECYLNNSKILTGFSIEDDSSLYHPKLKGFEYISKILDGSLYEVVFKNIQEHFNSVDVLFHTYKSKAVGATGLHLHFGYDTKVEYNCLDILRSICNEQLMSSEFRKYSGRLPNNYCKSTWSLYEALYTILNEIRFSEGLLSLNKLASNKNHGVNVKNLINLAPDNDTIEYRWGNSSISKDEKTLSSYYKVCHEHFKRSFTGDRMLTLGGYTLSVVDTLGDTEVKVYKGSEYLGLFNIELDRSKAKSLCPVAISNLL
tara:strand:- start:769 stop:1560 length:792 start_codon:yes stop_codon:yes gene_type:complete